MAPLSPICSWPSACGIPTQSAPQSAWSPIGGGLLLPKAPRACAHWPAASANAVPPKPWSNRRRRGVCARPGLTGLSMSSRLCGSAVGSPDVLSAQLGLPSRQRCRRTRALCPGGQPGLCSQGHTLLVTHSGDATMYAWTAPLRWPDSSSTGPWMGLKPTRKPSSTPVCSPRRRAQPGCRVDLLRDHVVAW